MGDQNQPPKSARTSSQESPAPRLLDERDYYTSVSHFYRGELGRIMVWRQRLDATTNWAIISATAVVTFALGRPEVTHMVFMLSNVIVFLLLVIEARRYRYYDAYRARVRMLEAHFLAPVIMKRADMIEGDWRQLVAEDLLLPSFKIGIRESMARRLRRNYIWIFVILLFSWILKIYQHGGPLAGPWDLIEAAQQDQPIHPILFWGIIAGFYAVIVWLATYTQKERYESGELERRSAPGKSPWKI
jgi:uncharacterized membrane protein